MNFKTVSCIVLVIFCAFLQWQLPLAHCRRNKQTTCSLDSRLDYIKLAVQWQPGYCQRSGCKSEAKFSIHGLWPGRLQDKYSPNSCCSSEAFNETKLIPIETRLRDAWPSLRGSHSSFWRHEYQKHGTCTKNLIGFGNMTNYFQKTIQLYDNLKLNEILQRARIYPSNFQLLDRQQLTNVLASQHNGRKLELTCDSRSTFSLLKEIGFCFTQESPNQPIDCPQTSDTCSNQIVLLQSPN